MADLGKAYVQIVPSAKGIKGQIEGLLGGPATSAGASAGQQAGSAFASTLKKVVVAAGIGKIIKDAFSAGGALEQSFGGLETIYGAAADSAKDFALQAAAAGISANSYAEQAVSFGAALKAAYGGDTYKAMQAANTAIMDMADNSAKMGADIGSIQMAYQGFAKQNYTMLDNLKLGYGGTKKEMERLLKDATALSGVKYDIKNLGDVYDAIHVIQSELGLTGVAAAEAETTLTGSFGAVKGSVTNLLAALTTGTGLQSAMGNLGKSLGNFGKNVLRMSGNVVRQLPSMFQGLAATIGPELLPLATEVVNGLLIGLNANLPGLLTGGAGLLLSLVQGFMAELPQVITTAGAFVMNLLTGLNTSLPTLISTGFQIIQTILSGLISALPTILTTGFQILQTLVTGLLQNAPLLLESGMQTLSQFLAGIAQNLPQILEMGLTLLGELASGVISGIGKLLLSIPEIFSQFQSAFFAVDWNSLGLEIIAGIIRGINAAATSLFNTLVDLASSALNAAKSALGIGSPSKVFRDEVGKMIPAGAALGVDDDAQLFGRSITRMVDVAVSDFDRYTSPEQAVPAARASGTVIDYDRLAAAISARPVVIEGDTNKIFRVVRQTNLTRTRATNYNALGAMV